MAFNKVGFHAGGGGNKTGIGDYMGRLDAHGIPFCVKSVDDVGLAVAAAGYARVSGVDHQIVLRFTRPGGAVNDIPDFSKDPAAAAAEHWQRVKQSLASAPEFEAVKDLVWLEPTNEVDSHTQADFLGWFSYHIGLLANAEGYRVAMSGHNAGQPEMSDWRRPGFVAWLRLCAQRPRRLAVSLHEGKLGPMGDPPAKFYPHLIGRYTWLYRVCEELGIGRPSTLISEWSWAYNDMPEVDEAMADVAWLAKEVAQYAAIKGVFLWNLAGGTQWGELPNKLQRLIEPVTALTLEARFPDPDDQPPPVEPPPAGERPRPAKVRHTVHLMPQDSSLAEVQALVKQLHPTRSAFTYSHDAAHAIAYAGTADSAVVVYEPGRWVEDLEAYFREAGIRYELAQFPTQGPPTPPAQPDLGLIDMSVYFRPETGSRGDIFMLSNNWGAGPERCQLQLDGGYAYVTKNRQWEERRIGGETIDLVRDTSPGDGEYYESTGPWLPRWMKPGQLFTRIQTITFRYKASGKSVEKKPPYTMRSTIQFEAHDAAWVTPDGLVLRDVVRLAWLVDGQMDERYWFARGLGLVAWKKNDGRHSVITERIARGSQDDNVREPVG